MESCPKPILSVSTESDSIRRPAQLWVLAPRCPALRVVTNITGNSNKIVKKASDNLEDFLSKEFDFAVYCIMYIDHRGKRVKYPGVLIRFIDENMRITNLVTHCLEKCEL